MTLDGVDYETSADGHVFETRSRDGSCQPTSWFRAASQLCRVRGRLHDDGTVGPYGLEADPVWHCFHTEDGLRMDWYGIEATARYTPDVRLELDVTAERICYGRSRTLDAPSIEDVPAWCEDGPHTTTFHFDRGGDSMAYRCDVEAASTPGECGPPVGSGLPCVNGPPPAID